MLDVLIVGAGPAGAIAALVLARAGARVQLVDRATFPRDKLCGDTVNPGTLARLKSLGVAEDVEARSLRVDGMLVTGARGVAIEGSYPEGTSARAITTGCCCSAPSRPGVSSKRASRPAARSSTTAVTCRWFEARSSPTPG